MGGVVGEHYICILTAIAIKVLAFAFHVVQGQDWQQSSVREMCTITITKHDFQMTTSSTSISMAKTSILSSELDSTIAIYAKRAGKIVSQRRR